MVENLDSTHIAGSKHIDSITVSCNLIKFAEGSRLCKTNEITTIDHRSYVADLNIKKYFKTEIGSFNKINHRIIDPKKRTHRKNSMNIRKSYSIILR